MIEILTEAEIEKTLRIPIQLIRVNGTKDLAVAAKKIDPRLDRFLLFHVLDEDALEISSKPKSDVEKGVDSDNAANELCDLIDTLASKIPYVKLIVSKLLPRFDFEGEKTGMSVPNNVRKVMNVQLILRTHGLAHKDKTNPRVVVLDNGCLEWMDDEVKMIRIMKMNGRELTAFGKSQMLEGWTQALKKCVEKEGLGLPSDTEVPSLEEVHSRPATNAQDVTAPALRRPIPVIEDKPSKEPTERMSSPDKLKESPTSEQQLSAQSTTTPAKPLETTCPIPSETAAARQDEENGRSSLKPQDVSLPPDSPLDSSVKPEQVALPEEEEEESSPQIQQLPSDGKTASKDNSTNETSTTEEPTVSSTEIPVQNDKDAAAAQPEDEFHEAEDGGVG